MVVIDNRPITDAWMSQPQMVGDWTWKRIGADSIAEFGMERRIPLLQIACRGATRQVTIGRPGLNFPASGSLHIRTETDDRVFPAQANAERTLIYATLAASDPFLDSIAFSRGRFAVQLQDPGMFGQSIYLPAYPELTRVVEDCR